MSPPDVVYPVRRGSVNEELRWSLRSLRNLAHGRVVLTGYLPSQVVNPATVEFLPTQQTTQNGEYRNVALNLRAAVESDQVSDPFYLFNDDFYVMRPMARLPVWNRGPMAELVETYKRNHHAGTYFQGLVDTLALLRAEGFEDPLAFNLHIPMRVSKRPMLKALDLVSGLKAPHIRSVYAAIAKVKGTRHEDVKRRTGWKQEGWEQWPLLSSNDDSKGSGVLALLRATFPDPSPHEL